MILNRMKKKDQFSHSQEEKQKKRIVELDEKAEIIRDQISQLEQAYDKQSKEGERISERMESLKNQYRAQHLTLNSFAEENLIRDITKLQEALEHVVDLRNRILGAVGNCNLILKDIETSRVSEGMNEISSIINLEALQNIFIEIQVRSDTDSAQYNSVVKPVANPFKQKDNKLREQILNESSRKDRAELATADEVVSYGDSKESVEKIPVREI